MSREGSGAGPIRTCVGCRRRRPQGELIRLRWDGSEVRAEAAGERGPGRGAYLCAKMECWELAQRRGRLGRALRLEGRRLDQGTLAASLAVMITSSPGPPGRVQAAPPV